MLNITYIKQKFIFGLILIFVYLMSLDGCRWFALFRIL